MRTREDALRNSNPNRPYNPSIVDAKNMWNADREYMEKFRQEKKSVHESSFAKFIGITTVVTYFNRAFTDADDMQKNTSGSAIAKEQQTFNKILDLEVKIEESLNISNEGDEVAKNYIRSGNLKILPDTITPYVGDYFIMRYMDSDWLFNVTSVNKEASEMNAGWVCEFVVANTGQEFNYDDWAIKNKIEKTLHFYAAHIGTDYKSVLALDEIEELESLKEFYQYLGEMYSSHFYDKTLNIYTLRNMYHHDPDITQDLKHITNDYSRIYNSEVYYDNFLQHFMKENQIFFNVKNRITIPTALVGFQPYDYMNTLFYAIANQDKDNLKYIYYTVESVTNTSTFMPTTLYGFEYVKHVSYSYNDNIEMFPKNFFDIILHFDFSKLEAFDKIVYASDSYCFVEIIALFLSKLSKQDSLKRNKEISKRLMYLFTRKQKLNIDNILPQYMYYLFPIIGFIINCELNKKFNKYSKEKF